MATISDTINLMKQINRQNKPFLGGMDTNKTSMISTPTLRSKAAQESPYADYVKEDLYQNFMKIADKLKFDNRTKVTGTNFIEALMKDIASKPKNFEKYSYNMNESGTDTVIESVHNCIISSYGKRKIKELGALNRICGYNESMNNTIIDKEMEKFDREIALSTPEKINEKIAERVEKATTDFIASRNAKNDRIKEIYAKVSTFTGGTDPNANSMTNGNVNVPAAPGNTTVDQQTQNTETPHESAISFYKNKARSEINKIKGQPINLFEAMVIALSNAAISNKDLNKKYVNESKQLDMDSIIDDTAAIYTVMEECNVYGFYDINKEFVSNYISSLQGK